MIMNYQAFIRRRCIMSQSGKKNITETIEGAGYLRDALLVGILPHPLTPSRKGRGETSPPLDGRGSRGG
jgi:hypothetical protein